MACRLGLLYGMRITLPSQSPIPKIWCHILSLCILQSYLSILPRDSTHDLLHACARILASMLSSGRDIDVQFARCQDTRLVHALC
ncbi:hypothetical protein BO86DRAFT_233493 [Aspergillus japonicus CBS 114.51]|uniref:Uncharacterized protein n=2 Tax=Aspergillus TaxID=5052 RepID=A0A2V5IQD5_ASPV1|nr:hypothetical protein BO86DRAFT_233493 [Aspergillus japonicus CBS 114.51]PYI22066.1 hypothetical protein BO99DRAFT_44030 [Aspergillus violaceofuscus CBS 115571]RAH77078.1 hypothetical protein BO86DRAFT_233493 [Aspergillus japonicus CBS 114.51]